MSYAVKIGTTEAAWIHNAPTPDGYVRFDGNITDSLVWGDDVQNLREPTEAEASAALAAAQRAAIPTITRAQAKAALIVSGMIGYVQPALDVIPDPLQRALAQNDWDERLHFERSNPTLAAMASALNMTDEQLDGLFALAATL